MNQKVKIIKCFMLVGSVAIWTLLYGCQVTGSIDKVRVSLNKAINELSVQSSNWQSTLKELEKELVKDGRDTLANQVSQVMQKGIASGGVELRCNADFIGKRMRQELQRILDEYNGKEPKPLTPGICNIVPEAVDIGNLPIPSQLGVYGYDLKDVKVFLTYEGGSVSLEKFVSHPTHYFVGIDVSNPLMCSKSNRKIVLRHNGEDISSTNVIQKTCPAAPPQGSGRDLYNDEYNLGFNLFGISKDVKFGDRCSSGYERDSFQVMYTGGPGECTATTFKRGNQEVKLGWIDNDPENCKIKAHFGAPGSKSDTKCQIVIKEKPKKLPAPDCGCW